MPKKFCCTSVDSCLSYLNFEFSCSDSQTHHRTSLDRATQSHRKTRSSQIMLVAVPSTSDEQQQPANMSPPPQLWTSSYLPTPSSHPELQYHSLINTILTHGEPRKDRTGTGTISLFAPPQLRFSLADNTFPLLTTKRVPLRLVFEELMWFIRGQTDSTILSAKGVNIWDGNGSREALDRLGLHERRVGDLGPVYGFQWRHFGAEYKGCDADYTGQGVDQLKAVINAIVNNPTDRRIIMSAWNPAGAYSLFFKSCFKNSHPNHLPTPASQHPLTPSQKPPFIQI